MILINVPKLSKFSSPAKTRLLKLSSSSLTLYMSYFWVKKAPKVTQNLLKYWMNYDWTFIYINVAQLSGWEVSKIVYHSVPELFLCSVICIDLFLLILPLFSDIGCHQYEMLFLQLKMYLWPYHQICLNLPPPVKYTKEVLVNLKN